MTDRNQQLIFGEDFIDDHAKRMVRNPEVALVELVANAWDAGASRVDILWPSENEDMFSITDDGTGMTNKHFFYCWNHINYNRVMHQGRLVVFPGGSTKKRFAYGCNGKGRHSMFCFNDEYWVETWQEGTLNKYHIKRSHGSKPWEIISQSSEPRSGHGTRIYTTIQKGNKEIIEVRQLLGSKFIADPEFIVAVNGLPVEFEEIVAGSLRNVINIPGYGDIEVIKLHTEKGRTAKQNGLAWWINGRLVGKPGWDTLEGHLLDERRDPAKSITFIIFANILDPKEDVAPDWSDFILNPRTKAVHSAVAAFVLSSIQEEMKDFRSDRKREILERNSSVIRRLSGLSQKVITSFIDQIQLKCPNLKDQDLENVVNLLINLEKARRGYDFLERLASLPPDDLDGWNVIMEEWTVSGARAVLDELKWRIDLISELEKLVNNSNTDELHELQPLFEKGLWIFGPEYEDIRFHSNRTISTVVKEFFGKAVIENPRIRPDFVALPNASLGVYSCNEYDERGEVSGYAKVAIVELKRGGFVLTEKELEQAMKYARVINKSGKVSSKTQIICFVLGTDRNEDAREPLRQGNINVIPVPYGVVLSQAHARTFNLLNELNSIPKVCVEDKELRTVLDVAEQECLF